MADLVAARMGRDASYRADFSRALPAHRDSAVTSLGVRAAIAAYLRTLVAMNSRFDRAVRGDTTALTLAERHGFEVFEGKARCGTCHFAPLFSGTMPPDFVTSEPEIIGVPVRPVIHHAVLDPDEGRAGVTHATEHRYAFKVPTLRNVTLTAPYMHNGAFASLEQVVDFYDRGGGAGIGASVRGQTLDPAPLHLTHDERRDLVAFLGALTDTVVTREMNRPRR